MRPPLLAALLALCALPCVRAQNAPSPTSKSAGDPLASLDFLLGRWSAHATGGAAAGASADGTYTFARDLNGHVLQRTSTTSACTGPRQFDCAHRDQLTIFPDANGIPNHNASLFALFLDNEGHVIYYTLSTPNPHTAVFDSQSAPGTPHFRLTYHLEGATMTGTFAMSLPGSTDFRPYLEWTGSRL